MNESFFGCSMLFEVLIVSKFSSKLFDIWEQIIKHKFLCRWSPWIKERHQWIDSSSSRIRARNPPSRKRAWRTHRRLQGSRSCKLFMHFQKAFFPISHIFRVAKPKKSAPKPCPPNTELSVMKQSVALPSRKKKLKLFGEYRNKTF